MYDSIQGLFMRCQECGKMSYVAVEDTGAMFINGQMIIKDGWICDDCLPASAERFLKEFQKERDIRLGHEVN